MSLSRLNRVLALSCCIALGGILAIALVPWIDIEQEARAALAVPGAGPRSARRRGCHRGDRRKSRPKAGRFRKAADCREVFMPNWCDTWRKRVRESSCSI